MPTQAQESSTKRYGNAANQQEEKPTAGDGNPKGETNNQQRQSVQHSGIPSKDNQNGGDQNEKQDAKKKEPTDPAKKRRLIIIGSGVGIVLLIGAFVWWLYSRTYEDTDDAQIDGHLNAIASRVSGTVVAVYAENDQPVKAGKPLVDLDTRDYEVQVEQARANYEQALAQSSAQNPNVPITLTTNKGTLDVDEQEVLNAQAAEASAEHDYASNLAKLRQAEANNRKSQSDLIRYRELADKAEISKSDYDQYLANAGSGDASVEAARFAADASAKIVEQRKAQLRQQQAKFAQDQANSPRQLAIQQANVGSRKATVDSTKAQLDSALLNLSYCHIVSPVSGIATQRSAEIGATISVGQELIVIVQTENVWVTANFKETQLNKMRVGQPVKIKVDSLGESFEGEVQDMPAATGDKASLFPPENATGNYVKIVQRLPVRIRIKPNQKDFDKLRPGMSVEPKVYLK